MSPRAALCGLRLLPGRQAEDRVTESRVPGAGLEPLACRARSLRSRVGGGAAGRQYQRTAGAAARGARACAERAGRRRGTQSLRDVCVRPPPFRKPGSAATTAAHARRFVTVVSTDLKKILKSFWTGDWVHGADAWETNVVQEAFKPGLCGVLMWKDGQHYTQTASRPRDPVTSKIVSKFVTGTKSCMTGGWDPGTSVSL